MSGPGPGATRLQDRKTGCLWRCAPAGTTVKTGAVTQRPHPLWTDVPGQSTMPAERIALRAVYGKRNAASSRAPTGGYRQLPLRLVIVTTGRGSCHCPATGDGRHLAAAGPGRSGKPSRAEAHCLHRMSTERRNVCLFATLVLQRQRIRCRIDCRAVPTRMDLPHCTTIHAAAAGPVAAPSSRRAPWSGEYPTRQKCSLP